jgi:hypothetical protein
LVLVQSPIGRDLVLIPQVGEVLKWEVQIPVVAELQELVGCLDDAPVYVDGDTADECDAVRVL